MTIALGSSSVINVHRIVLGRLLLSWLGISIAIGGVIYYLGIEKIDQQLVALASTESSKLSDVAPPLINNPAVEHGALRQLNNEFARERFVVVELYNRQGKRVHEEVNPRFEAIEARLKQFPHTLPFDGDAHYDRFTVAGQTVLQVVVPIRDPAGEIAGFFEGVFVIEQAILDRLRRELLVSIATTLSTMLATTLVLYPVILTLNRDVIKFSRELLKGNIELMEVVGSAIAKRDSDTNIHNYRVAIYAVRLGEAVHLDPAPMRNLIAGAFLHDAGKIGISDNILLKPGRLSEEEFATMKNHVALGVDILAKSKWLEAARDVVESHHEKFDGSGYLRGLKGEEIPLNARIFAIVDVFDALTSRRPYKEPFPYDQAMDIIGRDAGSHFDPRLVDVFAGIAEPLYRQISALPDDRVEAELQALILRHFFAA